MKSYDVSRVVVALAFMLFTTWVTLYDLSPSYATIPNTLRLILDNLSTESFNLRSTIKQRNHNLRNKKIPDVILNDGVLMPVLAAGTWQYNSSTAEESVYNALTSGYTHVDTAHNYHNQDGVGRGIQRYLSEHEDKDRNDVFVTTKIPGCGSDGVGYESCGTDSAKAITENLKLLNLSHVDMLLVHFGPRGDKVEFGCGKENCDMIRDQWKAVQHAFMKKQTRSIGVSNFCISCLECLRTWKGTTVIPAVNQVQYHIGMGEDPSGLTTYTRQHGIVLQAYSPLGNNNELLVDGDLVGDIGGKHGKSSAQVALKWVLQNNVAVVTKSTKVKHMKEDLDLFDWNLSTEEMKRLNEQEEPAGDPSFTCSE